MPHSRLLLFAGVGGFGLLAQWIARIRSRADHVSVREWKRVTVFAVLVFFLVVHVLVAPVLLTFNAVSATFAQPYIQDAVGRVVAGAEFKNQDLVIVNHPIVFYGHYFHTARVLAGQSFPRRVRVLAPGNVPVRVHRPDEFTLVVRPEGGFLGHPFDDVYRGPTHVMKRGDQVSLAGMSVLITASTVDGRPAEAAFRFSVPLEDNSLRWLNWANGDYTSFEVPVVGDSIMIPASPLPF